MCSIFLVEDVIVLELKAKPFLLREDYVQVQRYLHIANVRLGILVNFRPRYLQPKRILRPDVHL
ncbi:MAG: GxxExxY protein [Candidatus Doudnabacteria bacterium]|nr:GxxExxY protein [Candidatus Doudnabacteria bacterium]